MLMTKPREVKTRLAQLAAAALMAAAWTVMRVLDNRIWGPGAEWRAEAVWRNEEISPLAELSSWLSPDRLLLFPILLAVVSFFLARTRVRTALAIAGAGAVLVYLIAAMDWLLVGP